MTTSNHGSAFHARSGLLAVSVIAVLATLLWPEATARAAAKTVKAAPMRFLVSTPKLRQALEITPVGDKLVFFKLTLGGSCRRTVTGVAPLKDGDYEMEEDEKGVMYAANEFVHREKSRCEIVLRIKDEGQRDRATVLQAEDCKSTCVPLEDVMIRTDTAATTAGGRGRQAP